MNITPINPPASLISTSGEKAKKGWNTQRNGKGQRNNYAQDRNQKGHHENQPQRTEVVVGNQLKAPAKSLTKTNAFFHLNNKEKRQGRQYDESGNEQQHKSD